MSEQNEMLPSDLQVIADIGFPHTANRVESELSRLRARVGELEGENQILRETRQRISNTAARLADEKQKLTERSESK